MGDIANDPMSAVRSLETDLGGDEDAQEPPTPQAHGLREAYIASVAFAGCQMAWAVQIGYTSPTFRKLGMPNKTLSYAWLAGPVTGIVVQPLVGTYSDACTSRMGRRRPFIVVGGFFAVLGLVGFSNAQAIGEALGDTDASHSAGLAFAVLFFWVLDAAVNVAQGPQRALMADIVESEQHAQGNAFFAFHNGVGKFLGYGLGSVCLASAGAVFSWFGTELRLLYTIAAVVIVVTVSITCVETHETRWQPSPGVAGRPPLWTLDGLRESWEDLSSTVRRVPTPVVRAFVVQFWAYFAWFTIFVYGSNWVGEEIYQGDPGEEEGDTCGTETDFLKGVQRANLGYLIMAALSSVWSLVLPSLCRRLGTRAVWAAHLLLMALLLLLTPAVRAGQKNAATAVLALLGFPLAATYQIPWSILTATTSRELHQDEKAWLSTVFNLAQCFPEIIVSVIGGPIVHAFGDVSAALALGGFGALAGMLCCVRVVEPDELFKSASAGPDVSGMPRYVDGASAPESSSQDASTGGPTGQSVNGGGRGAGRGGADPRAAAEPGGVAIGTVFMENAQMV